MSVHRQPGPPEEMNSSRSHNRRSERGYGSANAGLGSVALDEVAASKKQVDKGKGKINIP